MKMFTVSMFLILSTFIYADSIKMTSVNDEIFEVDQKEVVNAYTKIQDNIALIIENKDGTATIFNPRYEYGGKYLYFNKDNLENVDSYNGICLYFGFKNGHGGEYSIFNEKQEFPVHMVNMGKTGIPAKIQALKNNCSYYECGFVASILCSK